MLKTLELSPFLLAISLLSPSLDVLAQNTPEVFNDSEARIAEFETTSSSSLSSPTTTAAVSPPSVPNAADLESTASAAAERSNMKISGSSDETTNTVVTTASSTMAPADDPSTAGLTGEAPTPGAEDTRSSVTLPEGVIYQVTKPGTGEAAGTTDTKLIHYTLFKTDGTKLESSRDAEFPLPFQFTPDKSDAIPGMELGTAGMKVGEQRDIYVPSRLGYGSKGQAPRIPPDTDLLFHVELVDLKQPKHYE